MSARTRDDPVSGQVTSGHFCGAGNTYNVYFDMVFDQPFASPGSSVATASAATSSAPDEASKNAAEKPNKPVLHGKNPSATDSKSAKSTKGSASPDAAASNGYVTFNTTSNPVVQAKVGISYVSVANAVANRTAETTGWDFNATRTAARDAWNSALGKVQIAGGTAAQQQSFYTALYHSLLHPNVISDTNGQYYGFDGRTHTVDAGHSAAYANYSGWDICRSQAQLEALIAPQVASDTAQSMVDDCTQTGIFPKWSENNGESYVMVGDPADAVGVVLHRHRRCSRFLRIKHFASSSSTRALFAAE